MTFFGEYVPNGGSGSRKSSAADSGESDRRQDQTIGSGRTEDPSTRNVGDACERSQVSRRHTVKNSVSQHGDLALYALPDPQPMKADERISDVIGALQVEDQPCRRVQHRLESAQEVAWNADQLVVAVVLPRVHQSNDQCLERGRWHSPTDLSQLT